MIDIQDLHKEMHSIMSSKSTITSQELLLEIAVPQGVHAVFVDLPGIKDDSKEGAELTRDVVRTYVRNNPNDLYILVKKASDDPANWPYTLREFILSAKPKGLGLTPKQTVVVGTRALDFLKAERNDVRSLNELRERVNNRAVRDHEGTSLPLHLLELFSLSLEDKENCDFEQRKNRMLQQIKQGWDQCRDLLNDFTADDPEAEDLFSVFSVEKFSTDLTKKFQSLLTDQLTVLEKSLIERRQELSRVIPELEVDCARQGSAGPRESIQNFVSAISSTVTEIITGDFALLESKEGCDWLDTHGGTTEENLIAGHELAKELFNDYPMDFLQRMEDLDARAVKKVAMHRAMREMPRGKEEGCISVEEPWPLDMNIPIVGQYFRSSGSDLGIIRAINPSAQKITLRSVRIKNHEWTVPSSEHLDLILPLGMAIDKPSYGQFEAWHIPPGDYQKLTKVIVTSLDLKERVPSPWPHHPLSHRNEEVYIGNATIAFGSNQDVVPIDELWVELKVIWSDKEGPWKKRTALQDIIGKFADTKLVNQLSLTALSRWFHFQISHLEPDQQLPEKLVLQMMRTPKNVADQANWESAVADVVQLNARGTLVQLARLVSCAASVAVTRILNAAFAEVKKDASDDSRLSFLLESDSLMAECESVLKTYSRDCAERCSGELEDLIVSHSHAIHFDTLSNLFEACSCYEAEFLKEASPDSAGTSLLSRVRETLAAQRATLQKLDYTASNANSILYSEVCTQFWATKTILAGPMASKLYINFVRDLKDHPRLRISGGHRRRQAHHGDPLATALLRRLLYAFEPGDEDTGYSMNDPRPRTDDELLISFCLRPKREALKRQLAGLKRVNEYIRHVLKCIQRLRSKIYAGEHVDFLRRLGAIHETKHGIETRERETTTDSLERFD
eukprot:Protomagalhaensia_sp_Gyna_25__5252@NODE_642_length_2927_cov_11_673476_g441_i1_p1_GENE_NODE_642_length_2927_cov_11_673476_g441_i1NODE_642_length_2927_cov_11_673476_g441_i1_p1_ORF_typecomplete_len961_score203_64Dynamin_N/PF00350_23/1_8e13MMR_HSR1/PF01926_23/0_0054DASH_Duo1/PF08651_10/6_1e03DASH_Duo1/PF08651_10/2_7e03DASH_Duo1/PF08651_10/0_72T2SSM_b/PF10741_9/1_4e04T2SSM_b/PF10741_9/0_53_NODE_642_length_2927_cov_11_673476_g441_i11712885